MWKHFLDTILSRWYSVVFLFITPPEKELKWIKEQFLSDSEVKETTVRHEATSSEDSNEPTTSKNVAVSDENAEELTAPEKRTFGAEALDEEGNLQFITNLFFKL